MRSDLPSLGDLDALALLGKTLSITRTAEALHVTQPAISKRIRRLEDRLGVKLVERTANRIVLTTVGEDLASAADQAFLLLQGAVESATKRRVGPLRVRAYTTWALRWLIPRLPSYYAQHPDRAIEVTTSLQAVDFGKEAVDAAVRMGVDGKVPTTAKRLQRHVLVPYATPKVALAMKKDPHDVVLLVSLARPQDWSFWSSRRGVELPPRSVAFESTSLAIQAALQDLGAVICAPMLVGEELNRGTLIPLDSIPVATDSSYWLITAPGRHDADVTAFTTWLTAEARRKVRLGSSLGSDAKAEAFFRILR